MKGAAAGVNGRDVDVDGITAEVDGRDAGDAGLDAGLDDDFWDCDKRCAVSILAMFTFRHQGVPSMFKSSAMICRR